MKKLLVALTLTVFASGAAFADNLEDRENLMKALGKAVGLGCPDRQGRSSVRCRCRCRCI